MLDVLLHWYAHGEVYTIFLVWIVVPLAHLGLFMYLRRRYGFAESNNGND